MTVEKNADELRLLYQDIRFVKAELDLWQDRLIRRFTASMAEFDGIMQACDDALYQITQVCPPPGGAGERNKIPPDRE